jgi:hypothetical protein
MLAATIASIPTASSTIRSVSGGARFPNAVREVLQEVEDRLTPLWELAQLVADARPEMFYMEDNVARAWLRLRNDWQPLRAWVQIYADSGESAAGDSPWPDGEDNPLNLFNYFMGRLVLPASLWDMGAKSKADGPVSRDVASGLVQINHDLDLLHEHPGHRLSDSLGYAWWGEDPTA